jgi:hypothetical protein
MFGVVVEKIWNFDVSGYFCGFLRNPGASLQNYWGLFLELLF